MSAATGIAVGSAALGAAGGIFGGLLSNNSGGGIDTKSISNTMDEYLGQLRATISQGREKINEYANQTLAQERNARKGYRNQTDRLSGEFWKGLGIENEGLIERASALVEEYEGDVYEALTVLMDTTIALNESFGGEMGALIDTYGSIDEAIDARLVEDNRVNEERYTDSRNQARDLFRQESLADIEATKDAVFGEDEKFLSNVQGIDDKFRAEGVASEATQKAEEDANLAARDAKNLAAEQEFRDDRLKEANQLESSIQGDTGNFMSQLASVVSGSKSESDALQAKLEAGTVTVDSEAEAARSLAFNTRNAAQFGAMADSLSKMAQQTRMDLLATADPRALELSAIADQNAAAMMSGQISADVQANLARSSAMRALGGGFGAGSDMGRGLAARDLGLTSLDLMQRGTQMYDAQRRLNYDTRVAGTQVNPFDVMQTSGLSTAQALSTASSNADMMNRDRITAAQIGGQNINARMDTQRAGLTSGMDNLRLGRTAASDQRANTFAGIFDARRLNNADAYREQNASSIQRLLQRGRDSAESYRNMGNTFLQSRDARIGALNTASAQRQGTYDATFASRLDETDNIFDNANRLDAFRAETARDTNLRGTSMRMGVVQDQFNNLYGLSDTIFNTNTGLGQQKLAVGLGASDSIYKTNVGGLGTIAAAGYDREGAIYQGRVNTALTTGGWKAAYEGAALNAMAEGLGNAAATNANIPVLQAAQSNSRAQQAAQIWGSALSSGSSLAGAFLGSSRGFSAMPNRNVGSYWSQGNNPMGLTQDQASFVGNANW